MVKTNNAITNQNGAIDYSKSNAPLLAALLLNSLLQDHKRSYLSLRKFEELAFS